MADITKLESELWEAADELRANSKLSSQEYCMPVLGLIFLRYAWGRFKRIDEQIDAERAKIEGRRPPKDPADYTAKGAMYLPEEARYDYLVNLSDEQDIGRAVNDAMAADRKSVV
nr:type I restriction-modification system subunit M N-terminal domain-containing protein [uncultured Adlercreutzia sp.]